MSRVFRGKFMERLDHVRKTGALKFTGGAYGNLKNMLYSKNWMVSVRDSVKRPEHVLEYFARYTHRVAIANSRIKKLENGMVSITAKNRKKKRIETITITSVELTGGSSCTVCQAVLSESSIMVFWPTTIVTNI